MRHVFEDVVYETSAISPDPNVSFSISQYLKAQNDGWVIRKQ